MLWFSCIDDWQTMVDFCDICRLYSWEMWLGITARKNLNLGQNLRTIRPTIILGHSAYVFHSFTFKEKFCWRKSLIFPLGLSLGKWLKLILFLIRLLANKCRSSFWTSFLICPFKMFKSQLSPVHWNTLPFFIFVTTMSEKCLPNSLRRVSLLPDERHTPTLFSRSWSYLKGDNLKNKFNIHRAVLFSRLHYKDGSFK